MAAPVAWVNEARVYGRPEMRRLAFIGIAQRLGIPLDVAAAVVDASDAAWRTTVNGQIGELGELIARAQVAQRFLAHALMCPAEHRPATAGS